MFTSTFKFVKNHIYLSLILVSIFIVGCGDDRGGVIVDSSGQQGGGTQPGGGGFAFTLLALVIFCCAGAMFAMDRINKRKIDESDKSDSDENIEQ